MDDLVLIPLLEKESQLSSMCDQECKSMLEASNLTYNSLKAGLSKKPSLEEIASTSEKFSGITEENKKATLRFKRDFKKKNGYEANKQHCDPSFKKLSKLMEYIMRKLTKSSRQFG